MTTTEFLAQADPLLVRAISVLLASKISPALRQDGQDLAQALLVRYQQIDLPDARRHDGSEAKDRRYDPSSESNFIRSRWTRVGTF